MAYRKVNSPEHLENGGFFFSDAPSQLQKKHYISFFLHIPINNDVEASDKIVSNFVCHLGCTQNARSWVFLNFQNTASSLLYYLAFKRAISMESILG